MSDSRLPFDPVARAGQHWHDHGWADAALGMRAVTSVMRAHQILLARVEDVLRPHGLTFARYEVLMLLSFTRSGRMPLSRLGQRLQVHPASVTNVIDRLSKQDLVIRVPHPADRRTTLAELTPTGRAVAESATADLNRKVFESMGLEEDKLLDLVEVLTALRAQAGDFDAEPSVPENGADG